MQYWVEKKARGRSDIPQWKRDQEPSLLNFDLAHVVEEWKHIAIRSTGARFPPPQNSLREVALFHARLYSGRAEQLATARPPQGFRKSSRAEVETVERRRVS